MLAIIVPLALSLMLICCGWTAKTTKFRLSHFSRINSMKLSIPRDQRLNRPKICLYLSQNMSTMYRVSRLDGKLQISTVSFPVFILMLHCWVWPGTSWTQISREVCLLPEPLQHWKWSSDYDCFQLKTARCKRILVGMSPPVIPENPVILEKAIALVTLESDLCWLHLATSQLYHAVAPRQLWAAAWPLASYKTLVAPVG